MQEAQNIYQKLAEIRKQVEVIRRNKKGYGYTYVSEDEILAKISGQMKKLNLSLIPSVVPGTMRVAPYNTKKTKSSNRGDVYEENVNEVLVSADMTFSWVNNENPEERVEVPWVLVGHQSDGSQSFGSGLSYAMRYFLLKFFNVATPDDDPDQWRRKQRESDAAADKAVASEIIREFDTAVRDYLAKEPKQGEAVKKFAERYVKGGDYFSITESLLASKILEDFQKTFLKGE